MLESQKPKNIITDKQKAINPYPDVFFGGNKIDRVTNIKFLGVILTQTLEWTDHQNYVISKINKNIGYLYRARRILDQKELINLYKSFIEPYITYCLPIWGNYINLDCKTNPLTKTLNRIKRIMTFSKRTHIANNRITLPNLKQYYTLEISKVAHDFIYNNDNIPLVYKEKITKSRRQTDNTNTDLTRSSGLILPKYNTNIKKLSFKYSIASTWNSLPYPVRLKNLKDTFIETLCRYMTETQNYNE